VRRAAWVAVELLGWAVFICLVLLLAPGLRR